MRGVTEFQRYLLGYQVDLKILQDFLKEFPEARYEGIIYRGMYFSHYPAFAEISQTNLCSWSSDRDTAALFASHGKYGFILSKKSRGYDVHKILDILKEKGECPERLKNYRLSVSEHEVLDSLNIGEVKIQRVGLC